jgi:hypothetical protein
MNTIINSLPKLTKEQRNNKEEYCNNCSNKDNFTVKKCKYSEGFTGMDIGDLKNIGSNFTPENVSKKPFVQLSRFSNLMKKGKDPEQTVKNLPNIHGIDITIDKEIKEEHDAVLFEPDTLTKLYAGSLSIIGLFILFRVVKKSM